MRTLICPDIHERYTQLLKIEDKFFHKADRIVMLGDYWDSFQHRLTNAKLVATWILCHINDPKFTFLWGNHDHHYAFKKTGFSFGYVEDTQRLLDEEFSTDVWRKFKIWTEVGPYLVSHAGFNEGTIHLKDQADQAIEAAFNGVYHPLWAAGYSVGGNVPFGGPTWLRFWELGVPGTLQLVGHTPQAQPKTDDTGNVCLDTHLKHVGWYDDETDLLTFEVV